MVVSPACGSDEKCGITGGEDLRLLQPEHSCTVHCDQFHYGPVSGSVEASGVTGGEMMVVIGRLRFGRDADGGLGGAIDGWGGGYRQDRDIDRINR